MFLALTVVIVLLVHIAKVRRTREPFRWPVFEMVVSSVAFTAWAVALTDTPLRDFSGYKIEIGGFIVLATTAMIGLVADALDRNLVATPINDPSAGAALRRDARHLRRLGPAHRDEDRLSVARRSPCPLPDAPHPARGRHARAPDPLARRAPAGADRRRDLADRQLRGPVRRARRDRRPDAPGRRRRRAVGALLAVRRDGPRASLRRAARRRVLRPAARRDGRRRTRREPAGRPCAVRALGLRAG